MVMGTERISWEINGSQGRMVKSLGDKAIFLSCVDEMEFEAESSSLAAKGDLQW